MKERRIAKGIKRGRCFEIEVNGDKIDAYEGETVAAALIAAGLKTFRRTSRNDHPRGMYCGIGLCYECMMVINGKPNTRACQTLVSHGCQVETQEGLGKLETSG